MIGWHTASAHFEKGPAARAVPASRIRQSPYKLARRSHHQPLIGASRDVRHCSYFDGGCGAGPPADTVDPSFVVEIEKPCVCFEPNFTLV